MRYIARIIDGDTCPDDGFPALDFCRLHGLKDRGSVGYSFRIGAADVEVSEEFARKHFFDPSGFEGEIRDCVTYEIESLKPGDLVEGEDGKIVGNFSAERIAEIFAEVSEANAAGRKANTRSDD